MQQSKDGKLTVSLIRVVGLKDSWHSRSVLNEIVHVLDLHLLERGECLSSVDRTRESFWGRQLALVSSIWIRHMHCSRERCLSHRIRHTRRGRYAPRA